MAVLSPANACITKPFALVSLAIECIATVENEAPWHRSFDLCRRDGFVLGPLRDEHQGLGVAYSI
jgi:hypothetical protein